MPSQNCFDFSEMNKLLDRVKMTQDQDPSDNDKTKSTCISL